MRDLFAQRLEHVGFRLEITRLDLLHLDAKSVEQAGNLGPLKNDADRAGDGITAGHDMIGGDRRNVAARCGNGSHHRNGWLLGRDPAQGLIDRLGPGRGAARAVDVDDQRLDVVGLFDFLQKFQRLAVAGDQTVDPNSGDMIGKSGKAAVHPGADKCAYNERTEHRDDRNDPPDTG